MAGEDVRRAKKDDSGRHTERYHLDDLWLAAFPRVRLFESVSRSSAKVRRGPQPHLTTQETVPPAMTAAY